MKIMVKNAHPTALTSSIDSQRQYDGAQRCQTSVPSVTMMMTRKKLRHIFFISLSIFTVSAHDRAAGGMVSAGRRKFSTSPPAVVVNFTA